MPERSSLDILLVVVAIAAPADIQRIGKAAQDQQIASMAGEMDMNLDRQFKPPPDEGGLL